MSSRYRLRWRDRRQTLPAKRRRRRRRRRDIERGGVREPKSVDESSASRGVRKRLGGAVLALVITVLCISVAVATSMATFSGLFALTLGASSLGAAVALIMSARNEEIVHDAAGRLDESDDELLIDSDGTDGWVE